MRSTWRAPLFAIVLAGAATTPGFGQEDEEEAGGEEAEAPSEEEGFGGDEGAEPAAAAEAPAAAAPAEGEAPPAEAAPESYVVQPGDTLWDLSERFLNNPWYWPKIWSYNPQLTNPNWIQPGTRVRFYPGGGEEPVQVEAGEPEEEVTEEDLGDDDFVDVPLFQDQGVKAPVIGAANAETGRREYFITDEQLDDAGRIKNSPEEKELLSVFDQTWLDLKQKPTPGDTLQVFEVARDLRHPVTGANLGKVVHTVGLARVDRVSDGQSLGTILASWDMVTRGTYVGALEQIDIDSVEPTPNEKEAQGYVVDTARFPVRNIGQNHIVFIDRGKNDGVKPGNTFTVVRAFDAFTGDSRGLTDEDIGKILVVDAGNKGSTGVVVASSREIVAGDRIEMRKGE